MRMVTSGEGAENGQKTGRGPWALAPLTGLDIWLGQRWTERPARGWLQALPVLSPSPVFTDRQERGQVLQA